jgi:hypothetical protein
VTRREDALAYVDGVLDFLCSPAWATHSPTPLARDCSAAVALGARARLLGVVDYPDNPASNARWAPFCVENRLDPQVLVEDHAVWVSWVRGEVAWQDRHRAPARGRASTAAQVRKVLEAVGWSRRKSGAWRHRRDRDAAMTTAEVLECVAYDLAELYR